MRRGAWVAVKEPKAGDLSAKSSQAWEREIQIMGCIQNPFIVELVGICVSPLKMVMECCPGGDLYTLLRRAREGDQSVIRKLGWDMRLAMIEDVASGRVSYDLFVDTEPL